jgi:hypothetical protein
MPMEDCTNGIDDDGDNKIDCEDDDCIMVQGFACEPIAKGATAIGFLQAGAGCPAGETELAVDDCSACLGPVVDPGGCDVSIAVYKSKTCNNAFDIATNGSGCSDVDVTSPGTCGAKASVTPDNMASCTPQPAAAPVALVSCSLKGGHCKDPKQVCAPAMPAPSCSFFDGDVDCPGMLKKQLIFANAGGNCDCTCDVVQSCTLPFAGVNAVAWDSASCDPMGAMKKNIPIDGLCKDTTIKHVLSVDVPAPPATATVTVGVMNGSPAITACCK